MAKDDSNYRYRTGSDGKRYNFNVTAEKPKGAPIPKPRPVVAAKKVSAAPATKPKSEPVKTAAAPAKVSTPKADSAPKGDTGIRKSPSEVVKSAAPKKTGSYGGSIGAFGRGAANMLGGDYVAAAGDYAVKKLIGRDTTYAKELQQEREKTDAAISKDTGPYVSGAGAMTALLARKAYKIGAGGGRYSGGTAPKSLPSSSTKALPAPPKNGLPAPSETKALPAPPKRLTGPKPSAVSKNKAYPSMWDGPMGGSSRFANGGKVRGDGAARIKTKGRSC